MGIFDYIQANSGTANAALPFAQPIQYITQDGPDGTVQIPVYADQATQAAPSPLGMLSNILQPTSYNTIETGDGTVQVPVYGTSLPNPSEADLLKSNFNIVFTPEQQAYADAHPYSSIAETLASMQDWAAGIQNAQNLATYQKSLSGQQLTPLEKFLVDNPSIAASYLARGTGNAYQGISDPNSQDNSAFWKSYEDRWGITPQDYNAAASNWAANNTAAANAARDTNNGFGLGSIISTIAKFTPLAPIAYAYDAVNALQNGNILGAGLSALGGYYGVTGGNLAGDVGSTVTDAVGANVSDLANKAIGTGLMGTAGALGGGANLDQALQSGALSGAIGYGSGLLGGLFNQVTAPTTDSSAGADTLGGGGDITVTGGDTAPVDNFYNAGMFGPDPTSTLNDLISQQAQNILPDTFYAAGAFGNDPTSTLNDLISQQQSPTVAPVDNFYNAGMFGPDPTSTLNDLIGQGTGMAETTPDLMTLLQNQYTADPTSMPSWLQDPANSMTQDQLYGGLNGTFNPTTGNWNSTIDQLTASNAVNGTAGGSIKSLLGALTSGAGAASQAVAAGVGAGGKTPKSGLQVSSGVLDMLAQMTAASKKANRAPVNSGIGAGDMKWVRMTPSGTVNSALGGSTGASIYPTGSTTPAPGNGVSEAGTNIL